MPDVSRLAVSYARYSSGSQRDVSIEQQHRDNRAFAEREGLTIVAEYSDHARSGYKDTERRLEFNKMIRAAESGTFGVIIAWKVDRFARNREDAAIYKGRLRRHGVRVLYTMEPIPEGSAGILLESMLEATAEWYSASLSENIRRGLASNARQRLHNGRRIYGYSVDSSGHFVPDPATAPIVRQIFAAYQAGRSFQRIADELNRQGIPAPRSNLWRVETIRRMLSSVAYLGIYEYKEIRQENAFPPLVSSETFEKVASLMKQQHKPRARGSVDFALTGLLFCGHCGAAMCGDSGTGKSGARHYYYSCPHKKRRPRTCDKKSVQKDVIENAVVDYLLDHVLTPAVLDQLADAILAEQSRQPHDDPAAAIEHDLAATRRKIANINNAIADGIYTASTLQLLQDLEAAAARLEDSLAAAQFSAAQLLTRNRILFWFDRFRAIDRRDPAAVARLLRIFVNAVYLYDDHFLLLVNASDQEHAVPFSALSASFLCSDNGADTPHSWNNPNPAPFLLLQHGRVVCFCVPI